MENVHLLSEVCVFWGWKNKPSIITATFRAWPIFGPNCTDGAITCAGFVQTSPRIKKTHHPQLHLLRPSLIFGVRILTGLRNKTSWTANVSAITLEGILIFYFLLHLLLDIFLFYKNVSFYFLYFFTLCFYIIIYSIKMLFCFIFFFIFYI